MKFNWGTGIFIFLIVFLLACAAFIIFAFNQDVNLVYKDYYEKGVDYTEQMNVEERSAKYTKALQVQLKDEFLIVDFTKLLVSEIDSGNVLLYRPSSSKQDLNFSLNSSGNSLKIPKQDLVAGRYILKFFWYSEGLKYEIDKPVNIQ